MADLIALYPYACQSFSAPSLQTSMTALGRPDCARHRRSHECAGTWYPLKNAAMSSKFRLVTGAFHTDAAKQTLDFVRAHAIVDNGRDS
jgi:hypothetical protein